jgi:hypothetical protein
LVLSLSQIATLSTNAYPRRNLHRIFSEVMHDPAVPAHRLIFEAMNRAYRLGQDAL